LSLALELTYLQRLEKRQGRTGRFVRRALPVAQLKGHAMATPAFEDIVEDFEFLEDWEDRYRYVIEQGKAMEPLVDALKVPSTKVDGCASQVWLHPSIENGIFRFDGDSDAMIVRGLIAVLRALYNEVKVSDIAKIDARTEMARLGLNDHLSAQRSNGLRAMIERIQYVVAIS
jgi:cysteine desulfuration protein SufE